MYMSNRVRFIFLRLLVAGLLAPAALAQAQPESSYEQEEPLLTFDLEMLAKAQPDECYGGLGVPGAPAEGPPCTEGVPKVNQAYPWGLTRAPMSLWLGTAPNTHCLVFGGFLGGTNPLETDFYACEYGVSAFSPPLPEEIGDWRPPQIFRYHLVERKLEEFTPDDPLIEGTLGIRSAGSLGPWVLLGGPVRPGFELEGSELEGINLFAFEAVSGKYLGSINLPEYDNIRKWLEHEGVLYTAVGLTEGGGAVLRVEPRPAPGFPFLPAPGFPFPPAPGFPFPPAPEFPFDFEVVGVIPDGSGAELAVHDGHLFVSTWPDLLKGMVQWPPPLAGLWMSPPIPEDGLTAADADLYEKVWQVDDYEPDPFVAASYGGGALASFDGDLYWGTMHVPFLATRILFIFFTPPDAETYFEWVLNSSRAISIFRGRNFGTPEQEVDLLYGEEQLSVCNPFAGICTISDNNMQAAPLYGGSGFDHWFNNYTWVMKVWHGQLLVGTMDYTILVQDMLEELVGVPLPPLPLPVEEFGADLYRFPSGAEPAVAESLTGVGNWASYGVRTLVADKHALYLGMANPMNLLTDPDDDLPEGGWELLELTEPCSGPWCFCGRGYEAALIVPMIVWVGGAARRRGRRNTRV